MTIKRGDLLLIPFPFTDVSASKRRPVLALTRPDAYGDFSALPLTSRPHHVHAIPIGPADLRSGLLPAPSWIRTDRIVTLNASLVVKTVAAVADEVVARAVEQVCARLREE